MPEVIPTLEANPCLNGAAHVPTIASPDSLQIREHLDFLDRMAAQGADFSALGIIPPAS